MAGSEHGEGAGRTIRGTAKQKHSAAPWWKSHLERLAVPDKWSLRARFLYLTGLMLLLGSIFQIYFLNYTLDNTIDSRARDQLRLVAVNLGDIVIDRRALLLGQATAAAGVPEIQARLAQGDAQALLRFTKPYGDKISAGLDLGRITFRFFDSSGRNLLENIPLPPEGEQGLADRMLRQVLEDRVPRSGLVLADDALRLLAVTPVIHEGSHVGAVAITQDLAELLALHKHENLAALLRSAPGSGAKYSGDWAVQEGYGEGWESALEALDARRPGGVRERRGQWSYRLQPLQDYSGEQLGAVLLRFDTARMHEARQNRVYQLGGLFVSGAVLLWAILFFNVQRIERFLARLKKIIVASHSSDFTERFESDHVHCLDVMHCHNEECPVFLDPSRVCYLETGSEAISPKWRDTCIFLNKYDTCMACPVYTMRKGDELAEMRNVVNTMMRHWKTFLSRSGHLLAYVLRSQETTGQIPSLDVVSKRLEQMAKLTFFGHDLQGTLDKDEVYQQLADVFKREFGLSTFVLFEVDHDADRIVIALDESRDSMLCKREVLLSTEICRAKRVSEDVFSFYNPVLCPYFSCDTDKYVRCCLPMVMGGQVGAVFSFVAPKNQWLTLREELIPIMRKYLDTAAPVLSSLRLLRLSKELALRDPLTHSHNRRFLDEFIAKYEPLSEREGRRTGFLMADLDYFKQVNDEYGHEAGDLVLKQVVAVINGSIRRSDLLIRYGGEEFLVLLQDVKNGMAETVAEKIRAQVEMTAFDLGSGVSINKTISVGVAEYPDDGNTLYKAIKFADVALYAAKNQGRNRVVRFQPEMWTGDQY